MNIALAKAAGISVITVSIFMFLPGIPVFDAQAQQGGAATGGDATTGGFNCAVAYACPITQAPRGGDATGGNVSTSPPSSSLPLETSALTDSAPQRPSQNITQTQSSLPPLGIYYHKFPEVDFSSEQVLVQLSNGTQIQAPKTRIFDNGTTIDMLDCIKTMTPAYGPDDAVVSCGPFIRTYQ
jgi:hypothetical protein